MPTSTLLAKPRIVLAILLIAIAPGLHADEAQRAMTVDDALNMVQVRNPLISPDGAWVLYEKRTMNWKENKYDQEYWRVSADGS